MNQGYAELRLVWAGSQPKNVAPESKKPAQGGFSHIKERTQSACTVTCRCSKPLDPQAHLLARLEIDRVRLDAHAHARRRAGGDDVARLQARAAAQVTDNLGHAEHHGSRIAVLIALAVDSSHSSKVCGSATSSAVTSHGPIGPKVSKPLPLSQVPPRSICHSRSDTSLTMQ